SPTPPRAKTWKITISCKPAVCYVRLTGPCRLCIATWLFAVGGRSVVLLKRAGRFVIDAVVRRSAYVRGLQQRRRALEICLGISDGKASPAAEEGWERLLEKGGSANSKTGIMVHLEAYLQQGAIRTVMIGEPFSLSTQSSPGHTDCAVATGATGSWSG